MCGREGSNVSAQVIEEKIMVSCEWTRTAAWVPISVRLGGVQIKRRLEWNLDRKSVV